MLTPTQARARILDGDKVRMVVGAAPDDPTLVVWLDDGCIMSAAIAGWSAGVIEPVCDRDSDFLLGYLDGRERLAIEPAS